MKRNPKSGTGRRFCWMRVVVLAIIAIGLESQPAWSADESSAEAADESAGASEPSAIQPATGPGSWPDPNAVSAFIRQMHEDRDGNLWFGTNGDGVARFDGKALRYFSLDEGFGGVAVRGILEDKDGHIWFGTEGGISRFDGQSFLNLGTEDGLPHSDVWSMAFDSDGALWVGTLEGAARLVDGSFVPFELPSTPRDPYRGVTSERIVHSITQDSRGRMWFGTNGGAFIWDGTTLSNLSVTDGLCGDAVNDILEDKDGSFWFATHHNGVCRFDGKSFTHVSKDAGIEGIEAWQFHLDDRGHIWFPIENEGLYRYDGNSFRNYTANQGLDCAVQCVMMDRAGRIWVGGYKGLFRLEGDRFVPVLKDGPWP